MRCPGVLVVVLIALVVAGCGSSSSNGSSGSPVNSELSYFPAGSPFVMSVATDPSSPAITQLQGLINRFPIASFGISAAKAKLDQLGIDYQGDIRPLFGNPVMFGVASATPTSATTSSQILFAWVTKDSGKLAGLIKKLPGIRAVGSHAGAKIYQESSAVTVAVDGATVLLGGTRTVVDAALDRHSGGGGMTSADYSRDLSGLPQDGAIQIFGNLAGVLSQPSAAKARVVPWVRAFRAYGVTIGASPTGLAFNYRLDTGGATLTPEQLPFATGTGTPHLAGSEPITVAIEDPAHIATFVESVAQQTSAAGYAKFVRNQAKLKARTGVDLNSLLKLLTGELIVSSDTHTTMARAAISDPASASAILGKLVSQPHSVFNTTTSVGRLGGGFYAIHSPKQTITIGVVGDQLVIGKAGVAALRSFAAAPTTPATGARGSVAFRVSLTQLLDLASASASSSKIVQTILGSLGDVTGWVASSPGAVTGNATLAIH